MKALFRTTATLFAVLLLAGCATAYQKRGLTGGYASKKIDDSHYVVQFDGNGFADKNRVWYFWLYRCAQLTLESGYRYFSVEPIVDNMSKTGFTSDDDHGQLTDTVLHGDGQGRLIDVRGGHTIVMFVPGGTITTWHSRAVVAMYGDDIPEKKVVVRAQSVLDMLGEYIRTNGKSVPPGRTAIFGESSFGITPDHKLVNIRQYMLAHPQLAQAMPPHPQPLDRYDVEKKPDATSGMLLATPPPPPSSSARIAPAVPTPDARSEPAASPDLLAAQASASRMSCSDVHANGNGTFIAQCSGYKVLIACDGTGCRPQHVIK